MVWPIFEAAGQEGLAVSAKPAFLAAAAIAASGQKGTPAIEPSRPLGRVAE